MPVNHEKQAGKAAKEVEKAANSSGKLISTRSKQLHWSKNEWQGTGYFKADASKIQEAHGQHVFWN